MGDKTSSGNKYFLTFTLGAIAGGIALAWATNAMPRLMSRMMQNMMAQMGKEGCNPEDV
jgi:hypothetical protein